MFAVVLGLLFLFTPSSTISQILSNFLIAGFAGYFGSFYVRQAQRGHR
jgi:hypothetical protein